MDAAQPSRTAWAAAAHRAAHQVLEQGRIFSDPLALPILGAYADAVVREAAEHPSRLRMRLFIALRTRFAEDAISAAVARDVRQIVILGAGLDTYAYRCPFSGPVRIFEVDHPATQSWKRQLLFAAAIPQPASLTFAPIDFEHQTLARGLAAAGFDPSLPTFFTWLGVVPYLTEAAVWSTLEFIANLPAAAHVVFDYSDPPETFSLELRAAHEIRAARVASLGEAWLTYFHPEQLHARLNSLGFSEIEDRVPNSPDQRGGHILHACSRQA